MVKKRRTVIWDTQAVDHLKEIYDYIKIDSLQAAQKVKSEILATTKILSSNPELFAVDLLKDNNDGSYRAFFIYSYRIAYKITDDSILILRIRHTSREPEEY